MNNLKNMFTRDLMATVDEDMAVTEKATQADITLPMSRMAALWDFGKDLIQTKGAKRPTQAYSQVDTVWICVNLIIDVALDIQLMLSTKDDKIVESGPAYDFLFNNKNLPYRTFVRETLGFYMLFREVYWIYDETDLLKPTHISVVGPRQIKPVIDRSTGELIAYELFKGNSSVTLDLDDVYCLKNYNPYNPHRGLGPVDAGSLTISTAFQAALYNESSLANGARLSTILKGAPGMNLDDKEIARLKKQFKSRHSGGASAGEVFYAQGIEVDTVSQTMADLQMVELNRATDNKICALFGVPPECVALNTEAQYASGPATQRLILFGVAPVLAALSEAIDDGIIDKYRFTSQKNTAVPYSQSKRFCGSRTPLNKKAFFRKRKLAAIQSNKNVFAWFDVDSHNAIQEMLLSKTEKVLKFKDANIPVNQIIEAHDLPYDTTQMPWGDHAWGTAGQLPLDWILDGGMETVLGPDLPEGTDEEAIEETGTDPEKNINLKEIEEKSTRIWKKYVASWQSLEMEMKEAIRQFLRRQKNGVLQRLRDELENKKSVNTKEAGDLIMRIIFDLRLENNELKSIHRRFYERGTKFGAAQIIKETAGTTGSELAEAANRAARTQAARRSLTISAHKIQKANKNTHQWLQETLQEGLSKGESLRQLSKRIQADNMFSSGRALRIARTSTSGAVSAGRFEGLKTVSDRKGWLSARNESVRPSHKNADTQYRRSSGGIGVNEKFQVGSSYLMYPGDPNGNVGEIANCRCMLIAVKAAGKTLDLDYYDKHITFLPYTEFKTLLNEVENGTV